MTDTVWTEDRIERLKTLWSRRMSASAVARDLGAGITRNAVLSKVHRMGLSRALRSGVTSDALPGGARPTSSSTKARRPVGRSASVGAVGAFCDTIEDPVPELPTTTLLNVGRFDCRFPYGDPHHGPLALCGRAVVRGVYCAAHGRIAYQGHAQSRDSLMALAGLG